MKKELLEVLACPFCKSDLIYRKNLICSKCKKVYNVENGIPNFVDNLR